LIKSKELALLMGYEGMFASHDFYIDMCQLGILKQTSEGYRVTDTFKVLIDYRVIEERESRYGYYQLWNQEKFSQIKVIEDEGIFLPTGEWDKWK